MADLAKGGSFVIPSDTIPNDIFTVGDFSEEQKLFQQTLKEFMAQEVLPQTGRIESKEWPLIKALILKLGELGALGAEIDEKYGGLGLDKTTAAILAEEMGWQGSFACTVLATTGIGLLPILYFGNDEQKRRFVPGVASGITIGAYSLTEPQAGSDAQALVAKAVLSRDGLSYILNGEKIFVTNGSLADYYVVFARIEGNKHISAFIVERNFAGVYVGKEEHKLGILGSSTTSLKLTDVSVPVANLLRDSDYDSFKVAINVLNLGRFKLAAACLGGAKQCFQEALLYSKERKQFKTAIGNFGAIRQKLCLMSAWIYGMESVVYRTAGLLDRSLGSVDKNNASELLKAIREYAVECSLIKVCCSEFGHKIALENVLLHGGNGFMKDYPAERHFRDTVINMIFEGTNEINRLTATGETLMRMAGALVQEGKKIRNELTSLSALSGSGSSDLTSVLLAQLNGARKALIVGGGSLVEKLGLKLKEPGNQEILLLLADCLVMIYVLESSLAVYAKHRKELNEYQTRLLFHIFLPELETKVKTLIAIGSQGDDQRVMLGAVRKLFKYTPDNIILLHEKIAESFV